MLTFKWDANKRGLRPTALTDITARARNTFKLVGGVRLSLQSPSFTVASTKVEPFNCVAEPTLPVALP